MCGYYGCLRLSNKIILYVWVRQDQKLKMQPNLYPAGTCQLRKPVLPDINDYKVSIVTKM